MEEVEEVNVDDLLELIRSHSIFGAYPGMHGVGRGIGGALKEHRRRALY